MTNSDSKRFSTRAIQRTIWIVAFFLVVILGAFLGYYSWDRYVHVGDQSPVELNIGNMEDAIRSKPEDQAARVALAETYLRAGRYEESLEQANQVLRLYPDNASALLIAGVASARLDRPHEALEPLNGFVAQRKDQPMAHTDRLLETAYYFLGESYVKLNRPTEAISVLEAALAIVPTDADALYQAGLAYQHSGQPQTALERYHHAVRLVPDFAETYRAMLESYSALGQPDHEVYARGMEAYSLQDYQLAQEHLEQATVALPHFGPAFLGMGLTYEKLGQLDAAQAAIQHALELNPDDFVAQQALGRIKATLNSQN